MKIFELPYFGNVDYTQLKDYYSTEITFNGNPLSLDLNFDRNILRDEDIVIIKEFLQRISVFEIQNKKMINVDFIEKGETLDYVNFFLEELDEEELREIINLKPSEKFNKEKLLNKLRLIRVGIYVMDEVEGENFAIFDYSIEIGNEISNQLLVVKTNNVGAINLITWES